MLVRSVPGGEVVTDGAPDGQFVATAGGHLRPSLTPNLGAGRLVVPGGRQGGALTPVPAIAVTPDGQFVAAAGGRLAPTTDMIPKGKFVIEVVAATGGHLTPVQPAEGGRLVLPGSRQGGSLSPSPATGGGRLGVAT